MTETMRSQVQVSETSYSRKIEGVSVHYLTKCVALRFENL